MTKKWLVSRQYLDAISSVRETQGDEIVVVEDEETMEEFDKWEKENKPKKTDLKKLKKKVKRDTGK